MYTRSAQKPVPMKNFSGGGATEEGGQVILRALNPKTGERVWEYPMTGIGSMWAGTVSNAGGVVFAGDDDGNVIALDAKTGKHLWNFNVGERLTASPIIYELDGKQYVAIASATAIFSFGLFEPVKAGAAAEDRDSEVSALTTMPSQAGFLVRLLGVSENALPGCGEEVAQLVVLHAGKPDQHDGVLHVVVGDVVRFGIVGEECSALFKIGADDKRPWFRRPVDSEARHQPLTQLERRRTVHRALLQVREVAPQRAHRLEVHRCFSHPRLPIIVLAFTRSKAGPGLARVTLHWVRRP